jgi:pyruvate/2-oxoglutarate dehydrogenase complex dihydrolipoamide dehydrogenase (E3) component
MFRRFGSEVTVLEYADRIIVREDAEVSNEIQAILEREGIRFLLDTREPKVRRMEHQAQGEARIAVTVRSRGRDHEIIGSHLLFAVGRRPNTDALGLKEAGIATDGRGYITVDDELRTNVPGIWALGDVNGRGAFTHTSYNDYQIVADNLLGKGARRVSDRIPAYALFIDPPLGRVGMSEAEVRATGRAALKAVMPMTRVGRARERGETQGFMKVLVDAQTQRLLGAALLCIEGDEIVHSLLDAMAADVPYTTIERAVHIHPTVSELIPTLLSELKPLNWPAR